MFSKLKKYSLEELLIFTSEYSRELFEQNNPVREVNINRYVGRYKASCTIHVGTWNLISLSYHAIKNTSDYRDRNINLEKFNELLCELNNIENDNSGEMLKDIGVDKAVLYIIYGLSQQQFWHQEIYQNIEMFNRNFEILINTQKKVNSKIDIDYIVKEEVGISREKYINISILLFAHGRRNIDISESIFSDADMELIKCEKSDIEKFLNYYSASYDEIRKSPLKKNHFITKPIIKTNSGKYIIANMFLMLKLLSDGLYWVIRNHYFKKNSSLFVNEFGMYFEKYVEELFKEFLNDYLFNKIDESSRDKKADWLIETSSYIFIIEQKSMLASIMLKQQYPKLDNLLKYIYKYEEAFEQLNSSEDIVKNNNELNKPIIKLILYYDSLYSTEIIKDEIVKKRGQNENDKNIYFISIRELEMLIYMIKNDEENFNRVIEEKLKREKENSNNGRDFEVILKEFKCYKNKYIIEHKNHFNRLIKELDPRIN